MPLGNTLENSFFFFLCDKRFTEFVYLTAKNSYSLARFARAFSCTFHSPSRPFHDTNINNLLCICVHNLSTWRWFFNFITLQIVQTAETLSYLSDDVLAPPNVVLAIGNGEDHPPCSQGRDRSSRKLNERISPGQHNMCCYFFYGYFCMVTENLKWLRRLPRIKSPFKSKLFGVLTACRERSLILQQNEQ